MFKLYIGSISILFVLNQTDLASIFHTWMPAAIYCQMVEPQQLRKMQRGKALSYNFPVALDKSFSTENRKSPKLHLKLC